MRTACKWCGALLGVLAGWVWVCPRCDYNEIGGGPDESRVRDQRPRP